MNRFLLTLLLCVFSISAMASDKVSFGVRDSMYSNILKEKRQFYVSLPPSYGVTEAKYPVLFVLDGDIHRWKAISGVLEGLSTDTLGNQVAEAIVVAVPNTDRSRDLTPSVLKKWVFEGRVLDTFSATGKASQFARFLQEELIPKVEVKYTTNGRKILVGESLGGLFGGYVLIHQPSVFTDYLLIDPTALWDNNYLNRAHLSANLKGKTRRVNVYFAFANNTKLGKIGTTNLKWGQDFASRIQLNIDKNYKFKQQYFERESHGTVALMGWYHGLRYLLANH